MQFGIGRRQFLSALGGAATAWPLVARAQQPPVPVIGYLSPGTPEPDADLVAAFRTGLSNTGYVESRNVVIEFRWAENESNRLPALPCSPQPASRATTACTENPGDILISCREPLPRSTSSPSRFAPPRTSKISSSRYREGRHRKHALPPSCRHSAPRSRLLD